MKLYTSEQLYKLANKLEKQANLFCGIIDESDIYILIESHLLQAQSRVLYAATLLEEQEIHDFVAEEIAIMQAEDEEASLTDYRELDKPYWTGEMQDNED